MIASVSRPKRLPQVDYVGPARYFLTFCVKSRRPLFADHVLAQQTIDHFLRTASDLRRFVKMAKQRSGAAYALESHERLWQEGSLSGSQVWTLRELVESIA